MLLMAGSGAPARQEVCYDACKPRRYAHETKSMLRVMPTLAMRSASSANPTASSALPLL